MPTLSSARDYLKQAEQCNRRAIAIYEQVFGPVYAETGQPLCGLAIIAELRGRDGQAAALYQQAQTVIEQSQGPEHPDLLDVLAGYARLLRKLGRKDEASILEARLTIIERKVDGTDRESFPQELDTHPAPTP